METEQNIGFLESILAMMEKYGLWKIFQGLMVLAAFLYIMYNVQNLPEIVSGAFSNQTELRQQEHDDAIKIRQSIKPEIDMLLKDALATTNADRVFVMEMHNGTNNVSGLPFIYGEMTYEEVRNQIPHIDEDYTSLNLSRFTFPLYLETKYIWYGHVNELEKVDSKLAARLISNDVSYIAIVSLQGVENELGYFGITYCNGKEPSNVKEVIRLITITTQKLSTLLDSKNPDNI